MKKGISPIVAVVLLIAIAVIAAVGLYFWVGGLATQQPTTSKPGVISATCTGGTIMVSNIGTTSVTGTDLDDSGGNGDCDFAGTNNCDAATLASGDTCVCDTSVTGSGTIYAATVGSAAYNC